MENQKPKNTNFKNVFFMLLVCAVVTAGCSMDQSAQKDDSSTQTDLHVTNPPSEQADEADHEVEVDLEETPAEAAETEEPMPVTSEPVNTPESTNVPVAENSIDEEIRESWTQILGAEVLEIDSENMVLSILPDEIAEDIEIEEKAEENASEKEEKAEKTQEILQVNVSELVLTQNTVILSKDDEETIVREDAEVISFDEIQENDFIVINYEGIENNEVLNVQSVTKMLYEVESELAEDEIAEGDMLYLQAEISELDTSENTLEYIYTYQEGSEDDAETFADKATVKLSEDGIVYQINDIDELNDLADSQEISFAELEVGQEIYINAQSTDEETNEIILLKQ